MPCLCALDRPSISSANSSAGSFGTSLRGFWKFSFFPKTERLKGQEKKSKEKETSEARQKMPPCPVDKWDLQRRGKAWMQQLRQQVKRE